MFVAAADRNADSLVDSIERRLPVVRVAGADVACVMAAVSGILSGAPGAAVVGGAFDGAAGGVAYASVERAPVIVIGSGVAVDVSGAEATKAALVVTPESAAHWIAHGCQLAMKEPWGPVRLDVSAATVGAPALPVATSCRPAPLAAPDTVSLGAAVRLLEGAERPLIVTGRFCRSEGEAAWVRPFAEARPAPVLATPAGRGVVPDPHPLAIGILDAGEAERTLLADADLVVAIGVDPTEVPPESWPRSKPVLELTPAAPESPDDRVVVVGDIGSILEELAPRLRDGRLAEWDVARLHALKQSASAPPTAPRPLAAYRVVETARRLTPAGTLAVFERGEAWREAERAWQALAPGECLIAAGGAREGFAIIAAAAAQLARPDQRVLCFTDSESIHRAGGHLATVAALGVPVLIVVGGDGAATPPLPAGLRGFTATRIADFAGLFDSAWRAGAPTVLTVAEIVILLD